MTKKNPEVPTAGKNRLSWLNVFKTLLKLNIVLLLICVFFFFFFANEINFYFKYFYLAIRFFWLIVKKKSVNQKIFSPGRRSYLVLFLLLLFIQFSYAWEMNAKLKYFCFPRLSVCLFDFFCPNTQLSAFFLRLVRPSLLSICMSFIISSITKRTLNCIHSPKGGRETKRCICEFVCICIGFEFIESQAT